MSRPNRRSPHVDFFPKGGEVVTGAKHYYTVQFNHRYILVNAADVTVSRTARH